MTRAFEADAILISTGSRPRLPDWADVDGDRILSTRDAYPPKVLPEHLVVVGSGVTGVEFVHMFSSFGSEVTLIVSRQQVLPNKDPEVAAVLEEDFVRRGVHLLKGARAVAVDTADAGVRVRCDDGRIVEGSHVLLAIGSVPNTEGIGLEAAGVSVDPAGRIAINRHCQTAVPHIFAAGDVSGKLPLAVGRLHARQKGGRIPRRRTDGGSHRHPNYERRALGHLHRAGDRRRRARRGRCLRQKAGRSG